MTIKSHYCNYKKIKHFLQYNYLVYYFSHKYVKYQTLCVRLIIFKHQFDLALNYDSFI